MAGDLLFDAARRIVTFHDADTPPVAPAADEGTAASAGDDLDLAAAGDTTVGAGDDLDLGAAADGSSAGAAPSVDAGATNSGVAPVQAPPGAPSPVGPSGDDDDPRPGFGRYLLRRRAVRVAAHPAQPGLSLAERSLLHDGLAAQSAYVAVPDVLMRAAVARHDPASTSARLPRSIREARASPQWPLWLAALKKEYGGLLAKGVFDEVDRAAVRDGVKVVPTRVLFNIKSDGTYKVRIVVRGDLTKEGEHYIATKSSMVSLDTVRTIVALAAGSDMPLYTVDFTQAFLNADLGEPHVYCGLPELPPEMCGGEFGAGGRAKVAHVHKAWTASTQRLEHGCSTSSGGSSNGLALGFSSTIATPSNGSGRGIG